MLGRVRCYDNVLAICIRLQVVRTHQSTDGEARGDKAG
jgi:hypothetical protein